MEYGINNKIKYTTLQIRSLLVKEINRKNDENGTDANPPRGDGEWARKSLFKEGFYYSGYNIKALINHNFLGPYTC